MSRLLTATANKDARARENRRYTQGVVVAVDLLQSLARVHVNACDMNGNDVYVENVPYPQQLTPQIGDSVSLGYSHSHPRSVYIAGNRLSGANASGGTVVAGGVTSLAASGNPALQGAVVLAAGAGASLSETGQTITLSGTGMSNPMTTAGDLIDGGTAGAAQRLAVGSNGQALVVTSGAPAWNTLSGTAPLSIAQAGTTVTFAFANQSANQILAGPASGGAAAPTFRALVAADYPLFGASGASHAAGAVPDPGSTAGTTRYLREDATWAAPSGGGGGALTENTEYEAANYTVSSTDVSIDADNTSASRTITLPEPGSGLLGRVFIIRRIANNANSVTVTVRTSIGTEFEGGLSSIVLATSGTSLFGSALQGGVILQCFDEAGTYTIRAVARL